MTDTDVNKNRLGRIAGLTILIVIIVVVILTVVIFPRMENFFLRKGLEYAQEKTLAVLPAEDGFNPDLHPVDPMFVRTSLTFLHESLDIDSLATKRFQGEIRDFMTTFKNCYNDQVVKPDEAVSIAASLDSLQRDFLTEHFIPIYNRLWKEFEVRSPQNAGRYMEILGFDSIAVFNDAVKPGLTEPYTVHLINLYYRAVSDKNISDDEYRNLTDAVLDIDRFQLRNEFQAACTFVFGSPEFEDFPEAREFRDNTRIILGRLRDMNYNYDEIKPTLRSFIFLWYERAGSIQNASFDLAKLYEFTKYAADHARIIQ